MINGIVCVAQNWAIGKNNKLLFNLKGDMTFFKNNTTNFGNGGVVIMGENTLLSLPKGSPLKNRINIVLCKLGHIYDNCLCVHTFEDLLSQINILSQTQTVWIIGGGMLYKSMLPYYDQVYVTKVSKIVEDADTYFPNLDTETNFNLVAESDSHEENDLSYKFCIYARSKKDE